MSKNTEIEYEFCQMPDGCRFENKFNRQLEIREPEPVASTQHKDTPSTGTELAYTGTEDFILLGVVAVVCIALGFLLIRRSYNDAAK